VSDSMLIDPFGRNIDYLRISVNDRCDFRCTYCMDENATFLPRKDILSLEEIVQVAKAFVALGTRKIRITGGEPLVRKDILWALEQIAVLPGLEELTITTNGSQLTKMADDLAEAGVRRLNVSIDTLDKDKFKLITRWGDMDKVLGYLASRIQASELLDWQDWLLQHRRQFDNKANLNRQLFLEKLLARWKMLAERR